MKKVGSQCPRRPCYDTPANRKFAEILLEMLKEKKKRVDINISESVLKRYHTTKRENCIAFENFLFPIDELAIAATVSYRML